MKTALEKARDGTDHLIRWMDVENTCWMLISLLWNLKIRRGEGVYDSPNREQVRNWVRLYKDRSP